jgi:hypothetical protein
MNRRGVDLKMAFESHGIEDRIMDSFRRQFLFKQLAKIDRVKLGQRINDGDTRLLCS